MRMFIRITTEAVLDPVKDIDKINLFKNNTNWHEISETMVGDIIYVNVKTVMAEAIEDRYKMFGGLEEHLNKVMDSLKEK